MRVRAPIAIACLVAFAGASCTGNGTGPTPTVTAGSASLQPSASSAPAASGLPLLTSVFTSVEHGYTIKYPPDWSIIPATHPWAFGSDGDTPDDPTADTFHSSGTLGLVVSSQALPSGTSDDQWFAAYLAGANPSHPECSPPRAEWESITIAGVAAGVHGGLTGCAYTEAVAIVAGRAYVFTAYPNLGAPTAAIFDRALFDALLAGVVFNPGAAK